METNLVGHINRHIWITVLVALSVFPYKAAKLASQHALAPHTLSGHQDIHQDLRGALPHPLTSRNLTSSGQFSPKIVSSPWVAEPTQISHPRTTLPKPKKAGLEGVHGLIFQYFQIHPTKTLQGNDGSIYFLDFRNNTFHLMLQGYLLEEVIPQKKLLLLSTINEERNSCKAPLLGYWWDSESFYLLARNYCYGTADWEPPAGVITFQTRKAGSLMQNCLDLSGSISHLRQEKRIPTPRELDSPTHCPTNPPSINLDEIKTQTVRTYSSPNDESFVYLIQQPSSDQPLSLQLTSNNYSIDISNSIWKNRTKDNPLIQIGSIWWSPDSSKFMLETNHYQEFCLLCAGKAVYYIFRADGVHMSTISGLSRAHPMGWSPNGMYYAFGFPDEIIIYAVDDQESYYWNLPFSDTGLVANLTWVPNTP